MSSEKYTTEPKMKYKIFISYSQGDNWLAFSIAKELEKCGVEVFLDNLEIQLGEVNDLKILNKLLDCNELWVLVTPTRQVLGTLTQPYVWLETGVAWGRNIPIVPILINISASSLSKDKDIPLFLKKRRGVEWHDDHQRKELLDLTRQKAKRKAISYIRALLYIEAEGGLEALDVANYLKALNDAYNRICYFNYLETFRFMDIEEYHSYLMNVDSLETDYGEFLNEDLGHLDAGHVHEWSTNLIVREVHLSSPGFWSFLGALNPLEALRNFLNDRHERQKDRKYRELAEASKLELENRLLEVSYLDKILNLTPYRDLPPEKLNQIVEPFIRKSLLTLGEYQDRRLLGKAHVKLTSNDSSSI